MNTNYILRKASLDDFPHLSDLEYASYPHDESASESQMMMRVEQANAFFLVYIDKNTSEIIGFVNGTCIDGREIPKESMSMHIPGKTLVIHSVVIVPSKRRQGLARHMLEAYLMMIKSYGSVDMILLLSKAQMMSLYIAVGFTVKRLSPVVHGIEPWFEMMIEVQDINAIEQLQIDAFCAAEAFTGNPAAVVFDHYDVSWMQKLANENNLAETVFISPINTSSSSTSYDDTSCVSYKIRWFSPNKEVDLCGHATLAAGYALYETQRVKLSDKIVFHSLHSGVLSCSRNHDGAITLDFPSTPPSHHMASTSSSLQPITASDRSILLTALDINDEELLYLGRTCYDVFAEISRPAFARLGDMLKDMNAIASLGGRGLIITTVGKKQYHHRGDEEDMMSSWSRYDVIQDPRYDFVSRCFFPLFGVNEDPVTGSAHCALAPFWMMKLKKVIDDNMVGYQASSRGGVVAVKMMRNDRVQLSGKCITTIKSKIVVG